MSGAADPVGIQKQGGLIAQFLALIAGFIDAIGYLVLFHMFTANMSGNSVVLGIAIGQHHLATAAHRAFPIPLFMAGVVIGSVLIELASRHGFTRIFALLFTLEAVLIALFLILAREFLANPENPVMSARFYTVAAMPALAMGVQTACLHRIGSIAIRTTFVTGMMTLFCRSAVESAFRIADRLRNRPGRKPVKLSLLATAICGGVWVLYLAGAAAASILFFSRGIDALAVPIVVLLIVVALYLLWGPTDLPEFP